MTGLGDLFDEAEGRAAREASDARLQGDAFGEVHTRVRRAHARRSALRASIVAVAVVVLGAGVAYGADRFGGAQVAHSPSPSVSPSGPASETPSPSPSPTPSETGFAWPGFKGSLTTDPHVPNASPITREAWASTGPGWALISYREAWSKDGADDRGPQVIYLVSPEGTRYELVNVPGETVSVLAWEAGSTSAPVSVQPDGEPPYAGMLDLVTGEVNPVDGYAPYIWSLAFLDADGAPIYTGNDATSAYVRIAPDGTQSAYTIPEEDGAAELAEAETGALSCSVQAPFDSSYVLVGCAYNLEGFSQQVLKVSAKHEIVEEMFRVLEDATLGAPTRVGEFAAAGFGGDTSGACPKTYATLRHQRAHTIPGSADALHPNASFFVPFGAYPGRFVWGTTSGCMDTGSPLVVVSSDVPDGELGYAVLMPYPEGWPAGEQPQQSVTGVAVSH